MQSRLQRLRIHAVTQSLFPPTTLKSAIQRLGFVQADPIRSPARAQDLILRHRVKEYRAGDLERRYAELDVEEDVLYAYGFLPRTIWRLLHPRQLPRMSQLEKKVLETVYEIGFAHPRELEAHFGKKRIVNAWGGYSKATTHALEWLHYRGLLRIARRENGIRVYEAAPASAEELSPAERLAKLIMVTANVLAPTPEKTFHANITRFRHIGNPRTVVRDLVHSGELTKDTIEDVTYLWPSCRVQDEAARSVRFLAPFDPLVWDRRRFEHLWQWPYRFEAYTPPAKRLRGYYAMPLLWGDAIIGWANANMVQGKLSVEVGFAGKRPKDADFRSELEAEIARLERFLKSPVDLSQE